MNAATPTDSAAAEITERVRLHYAEAARQVQMGDTCCATDCCSDQITSNLYDGLQTASLPAQAVQASLGCGNPTALIDLQPGETVLDLGAGGGIDVLLSARRVGPHGFAYGVDMTDEMLTLARSNQAQSGVTNATFLKGRIEALPLPDHSVDVVISNCVINLSTDKAAVLREAYRVLKPGGRFAVSDVVVEGELPASLRQDREAWVGCLASALAIDIYTDLLRAAGFTAISVEITRRYTLEDTRIPPSAADQDDTPAAGPLASAFVRATKPRHGAPTASTY